MSSLGLEYSLLAIILCRILRLANGSGTLERNAEVDILTVRDSTLDTTAVIRSCREPCGVVGVLDESVVMDAARDLNALEPGADLEPLGGWDR